MLSFLVWTQLDIKDFLVNDESGRVHNECSNTEKNGASSFIVRKEPQILLVTYRELKEGEPPLTVVSQTVTKFLGRITATHLS